MRKFILISLIIYSLLCFRNSYSQWYNQNSNGTSTLNSVFFIDRSTGWTCGLESVLKTTNSGSSWNNSYIPGDLKSIYFTDLNHGFVCGGNGKIFKTSNGGNSWESLNSGVIKTLSSICFIDQNSGFAIGRMSTIVKTTDGGSSWQQVITGNDTIDFLSLKILSSNDLLISGSSSTIFKSTDGGDNWEMFSFGVPNPLQALEFIDNNSGWVSGCCGMFMKTTDAGVHWTAETYLTPGFTIQSMKFINENTGFAAGDAGYILRTSDGGMNWDSLNSNTHRGIKSVCFVNNDTGFAVGLNGMILRTINGGGKGIPIGIEKSSNFTPTSFILYQNYPNPFNPVTNLKFEIPKTGFVSLKVYDMAGKEVKTLVNTGLTPGKYRYDFDASDLTSGIYFYRIIFTNEKSAEVYRDSKKMLLIK